MRRAVSAVLLSFMCVLAGCGEADQTTNNQQPSSAAPSPSAQKVFGQPHLADGKPLTLYLGAQYCPFCASMRWPLVKALSRFGTFANLGRQQSRSGVDGFGSIATYDFSATTYTSTYVTFRAVETADVNGNPLQQPDADSAALVNQFDPHGSIPFVFVAGEYVAQLPYSPGLLQGRKFDQILTDVNSTSPDEVGTAINAEADLLTALICSTDGSRPSTVCAAPPVQAMAHQLLQ